MPTTNFYPSLSTLIPTDNIPDNFGFLQNGINSILSNIYYKDLQTDISADGDSAEYSLSLFVYDQIGVDIPGTGMSFAINPSEGGSEFPISFSYTWHILKYSKDFDLSNFDYSPQTFFNLLLDIAGVSSNDLLTSALSTFISDPDPIQVFVDSFNTNYNTTPPLVPISGTDSDIIADLINQITNLYINGTITDDIFTVIFKLLLNVVDDDFGDELSHLQTLFNNFLGQFTIDNVKDLLVPQASFSLNNLTVALLFPRSILIPVDGSNNPLPEPNQSELSFDIGSVTYSTKDGLSFDSLGTFSFPKSQIGNTGIMISFADMKLDLSRTTNIPEVTAAGYPLDFIGAYIGQAEIDLPTYWNHNDGNSTAELIGTDLIIGTGGFSGKLTLQAKNGTDPAPFLDANFGDKFDVAITEFDMTFKQNVITDSNIAGTLKIPGFKDDSGNDAVIDIKAHIGTDGDFKVTASDDNGLTMHIPNILDFTVKSLSIGKENGKFFVSTSGSIDFKDQGGVIGKFIQSPIDIDELIIWQDGSIELKGFDGTIKLKNPVSLKVGPVNLTVTAIHFGTHEKMYGGVNRKYWFFGFDGGVNINPGGVDARGDGIKFYFTVDNDPNGTPSKPLNVYLSIQSININIILPGNASPETASLILNGYLSMKNPSDGDSSSPAATEYIGGISFSLPKIGLSGSANMRMEPSVPAFLVDIDLELPAPIPLGPTGLGIYGFRALLGQRYVASQSTVGISPSDPSRWYDYYKAKIAPDYQEGVQVSKFTEENGFSVGAGASIATAPDEGKTFSSKIFFMLSLPDLFLLQGQAAILKNRIGLDDTSDPPFSILLVLTPDDITAGIGVDYKLPDPSGDIATIKGLMQLGFSFHNATAWYVDIGKDTQPIEAKVFDLFQMEFYFMISSSGIKVGAKDVLQFHKGVWKFGIDFNVTISMAGRLSFHPTQVGASMDMSGSINIQFIISIGLGIDVSLGIDAARPFVITGSFSITLHLPWPLKKLGGTFTVSLTWTFNRNVDLTEVVLFNPSSAVKALNVMSGDTFPVYFDGNGGWPAIPSNIDSYIIPVDSYIDMEFLKSVGAQGTAASNFDGITGGVYNVDLIPPQQGVFNQMRHTYTVNDISIYYHDPVNSTNGGWTAYSPYAALSPIHDPANPFLSNTDTSSLKNGYWQAMAPNIYNRVRVFAQSPLSYMNQSRPLSTEQLGFQNGFLFCEEKAISPTCVDFKQRTTPFINNVTTVYKGVAFRMINSDGDIVQVPSSSYTQGLLIPIGSQLEIYLPGPVAYINLYISTFAPQVQVTYYSREQIGQDTDNLSFEGGVPLYEFAQISQNLYNPGDLSNPINYQSATSYISKVVIEGVGTCSGESLILQETGEYLLKEDSGHIELEEDSESISCATLLYDICWLNITDYLFNQSIPSQTSVTGQNQTMLTAISKTLQPIWRPDTTYLIQVQTEDNVNGGNGQTADYIRNFNIIFQTKGPLGHFHQYDPKYRTLLNQDLEDQYKLSTLKFYINYDLSYPNADGSLINAKPLFYGSSLFQPSLNIFFYQSYVYTMYNTFTPYGNTGQVISSLQILIKDPAEPGADVGVTPPPFPVANTSWKQDPSPKINNDVQVIKNLSSPQEGQEGTVTNCSGVINSTNITPMSTMLQVTPSSENGYLLPNKLYTAIFNASYQLVSDTTADIVEVHRYVFKTSQYQDFATQVNSYIMTTDDGQNKSAIYTITKNFGDTIINKAITVINGTLQITDTIYSQFQDNFNRLTDGVLQLGAITPAITTEFNIIKDSTTNNIIGVLVRNPEPFNDPKIPAEVLNNTLTMALNHGNTSDFTIIFSKDKSQAFITNTSMNVTPGTLTFNFQYAQPTESGYTLSSPVTVEFTIS